MTHHARARGFFATAIATTALIGALVSHIGIDFFGDFALAHDDYDDVPHASRFTIAEAGLALASVLIVSLVVRAWQESRSGGGAFRDALRDAMGASTLRFVGLSGVSTLSLVALMGLFDAGRAGGALDAASLLGGSVPLALAVTLPVAAACAIALRALLALTLRRSRAIVAIFASAVLPRTRAGTGAPLLAGRDRIAAFAARAVRIRENAGKRGPPLVA